MKITGKMINYQDWKMGQAEIEILPEELAKQLKEQGYIVLVKEEPKPTQECVYCGQSKEKCDDSMMCEGSSKPLKKECEHEWRGDTESNWYQCIKCKAICKEGKPEPKPERIEPSDFEEELRSLINRHSRENYSNTPDFILASFIRRCLEAGEYLIERREQWYGR